jgi:hypothetical protein
MRNVNSLHAYKIFSRQGTMKYSLMVEVPQSVYNFKFVAVCAYPGSGFFIVLYISSGKLQDNTLSKSRHLRKSFRIHNPPVFVSLML